MANLLFRKTADAGRRYVGNSQPIILKIGGGCGAGRPASIRVAHDVARFVVLALSPMARGQRKTGVGRGVHKTAPAGFPVWHFRHTTARGMTCALPPTNFY